MSRMWAWWSLAERVCARLSRPRVDVAAVDADAVALWRDSSIGAACRWLLSRAEAAWLDSWCRRVARKAAGRP